MGSVARRVSMPAGNEVVSTNGGAAQVLNILRKHVAPDAVDAAYQEVARLLRLRRTAQWAEASPFEVAALRRKAESRIQMGGVSPETFPSILCVRTAFLSRAENTPV